MTCFQPAFMWEAPWCKPETPWKPFLERAQVPGDSPKNAAAAASSGGGRDNASKLSRYMFAIIGILVVFGAVFGGYLMEHGNIRVLLQPAELLIIGGAAVGTVLIANPLHILKQIAGRNHRSL